MPFDKTRGWLALLVKKSDVGFYRQSDGFYPQSMGNNALDAFNHACVHRRAIQTFANNVVGLFIGMRDPARYLARMLFGAPHE